jgi:hypothetical protein
MQHKMYKVRRTPKLSSIWRNYPSMWLRWEGDKYFYEWERADLFTLQELFEFLQDLHPVELTDYDFSIFPVSVEQEEEMSIDEFMEQFDDQN